MLKFLLLLLVLAGSAGAQSTQVFYTGNLSFHYTQLFGPFNGDFEVEGTIDTTQWIPTLEEGLGGVIASVDSTGAEQLLSIAAKRVIDTDTTYHVFGVYYRSPGQIQAGDVVEPLSTVQLFLLWNLDSLAIPAELPDSLDLMEILGAISAEHKFVGAASAMNISLRDATTLDFTFSGTAIDIDNTTTIIFLTNGSAHMEGMDISAVDPAPPLRPRSILTLSPNPFNPGTRLQFFLEAPGDATLQVHDMAGRLIEERSLGWLPAGPHATLWNGDHRPSGMVCLSLSVNGRTLGVARGMLLK